jgi:Secretion system C-terminal sorting domain
MKTRYLYSLTSISLAKYFSLLLFITAFYIQANAQVGYSYDNNGNRTASIVIHPMSLVRNKDTTKKDSSKVLPVIKVFPNPTPNQFTVSISDFKSYEYATIYLSDASGNLLSIQKTSSTLFSMSLAAYNQGTYYLKIIMGDTEFPYTIIKNSPGAGTPPKPTVAK